MRLSSKHYDILIIGAALVGASAAVALTKQGFKVGLVDKKSPISQEANSDVWDSRIYAISPGNADWLKELGVWQKLDSTRISPIESMEIWSDANLEPLAFNAEDDFESHLGYILENSALQEALWAELQVLDVDVLIGAEAFALALTENLVILTLADGTQITANLMVAADGGNSWVRDQAGLSQQKTIYEQVGVVANFEVELSHRNVARQWFLEDGILAWLPLPGNRISMVFSSKHSQDLMELSSETLSLYVAKIGGNILGQLQCITPAVAFPLVRQNASALISNRLVLVGDAAHQVHPMAGQGVNLGFRDVIELVKVLAQRNPFADIGDKFVLRRYERSRKADVLSMQGLTHGLYGIFDSKDSRVKGLRNWGLNLPNRYPTLKRALMKRALS